MMMKSEELIKLTETQLEEVHEKVVEIASEELENEDNKAKEIKTLIDNVFSEQISKLIREKTKEREFVTTEKMTEFIQQCINVNKTEFYKFIKKHNGRTD